MARKALPEVDKLKDRIIDLAEEEFAALYDWMERVSEVREADKRAAERRAAARQTEVPK